MDLERVYGRYYRCWRTWAGVQANCRVTKSTSLIHTTVGLSCSARSSPSLSQKGASAIWKALHISRMDRETEGRTTRRARVEVVVHFFSYRWWNTRTRYRLQQKIQLVYALICLGVPKGLPVLSGTVAETLCLGFNCLRPNKEGDFDSHFTQHIPLL